MTDALERAEAAESALTRRCKCRFSSGGVLSQSCEFHTRLVRSMEHDAEKKVAEAVAKERAEWKSTMDTPEGSGARWIVGWHGESMTPSFIWWTVKYSVFPASVTKWSEWKQPVAAAIRGSSEGGGNAT